MWGHPRWAGHGGEVWQKVVPWRREWQTTSVFLPWEPQVQYEKAKWEDTERGTPQVSKCPICYWRSPILWPPDVKSWLIGKDRDAGKDWGQEKKEMTEDEMVGWHHQLDGHGFGWTLGVGDGQGGLACWGSWGHKESDTTEWLNWTETEIYLRRTLQNLAQPVKQQTTEEKPKGQ